MIEVWKYIDEYKGLYQVSNFGNIKSLNYNKTKKERLLKQYINARGYFNIELWKGTSGKQYISHRLIAQAFIPNPENKPQINHIDGNKQNNSLDNLEWCTQLENMQHANKTGLINNSGENNHFSKLNRDDVKEIRRMYFANGKQVEIAKWFNVSQSHISSIVNNKCWKTQEVK